MSIRVLPSLLLALATINATGGCYNLDGKPTREGAMVGSIELAVRRHGTDPPKRWRLRRVLDLLITAIAVAVSLAVVPLLLFVFALCVAFEHVRQYFGDRRR
jgi:hypothetical protein